MTLNLIRVCRIISVLNSIIIRMTDMENLDNTEEQKKSGYAALREKHAQEMADLQAKLDEQIAGRAADKKLYFANTMKGKGYEWDFNEFADKYSTLDINDMVSLYEGQHGKATIVPTASQPVTEQIWAKSVIEWANPTTEVGWKKLSEMNSDELIKLAKTQSRYHN